MNTVAAPLRAHRALLLIVLPYAAVAATLTGRLPTPFEILNVLAGFIVALLVGPVLVLCGYVIYVMTMLRPARLSHFLYQQLCRYLGQGRLLRALPVLLLTPLFTASFTIVKAAIPRLHPYAWDSRISAWDIALHGGQAPWLWLQPLLGHPWVTCLLNFTYHLWFLLLYSVLYWQFLDIRRPQLRMQFLLSFVLSCIVLGSVVAVLLSSVGPCYYGHLYSANPYAPLMAYLHTANQQVPVWALPVQDMLWQGYQSQGAQGELGISAMPSIHVATAMLMALLGWRANRAAGIAFSLFAVLIMLGSIHLGWHYALDGYVGAAGAALIWQLVGLALGARRSAAPVPMHAAPAMNRLPS